MAGEMCDPIPWVWQFIIWLLVCEEVHTGPSLKAEKAPVGSQHG